MGAPVRGRIADGPGERAQELSGGARDDRRKNKNGLERKLEIAESNPDFSGGVLL